MTSSERALLLAKQRVLQKQKARLRGLGDVVAVVTKAVGITPCTPCQERQARLNALVPFKKG